MAAPTVTLRNMLGCAEHTAQLPKDGAALKRLVHELWEIAPAHQLFVVDEKVVDPEDGGLRTRVAPESTIYVINADKSSYLSSFVFSWDALHVGPSLRIGSDGWVVSKMNSSPDVAIVLGEQPLTQGTYKWRLLVKGKHDEMWLGITDDAELHSKITGGEIRNHRHIWAYCDGRRRRSFPCGGPECLPSPPQYGSGDTVGFEFNATTGLLILTLNGNEVSRCSTVPTGRTYWPFAALDADGDEVHILSTR